MGVHQILTLSDLGGMGVNKMLKSSDVIHEPSPIGQQILAPDWLSQRKSLCSSNFQLVIVCIDIRSFLTMHWSAICDPGL